MGHYSIPGFLYFTLYAYLIILSVKQGDIKYHFWVLCMTRHGIEPQSSGSLADNLPNGWFGKFDTITIQKTLIWCLQLKGCIITGHVPNDRHCADDTVRLIERNCQSPRCIPCSVLYESSDWWPLSVQQLIANFSRTHCPSRTPRDKHAETTRVLWSTG